MPRILLVKTSSLGDVVHNLPLVNDIRRHAPHAQIDWVVEESFADIPRMHPGVRKVMPVALRRWRRSLRDPNTRAEICVALRLLRADRYDAIIDSQGLFKSAIVARAARGICYGLDWRSSREPLRPFYERTFRVPWGQHAVTRNRSLAAQALAYATDTAADYGIVASPRVLEWLPAGRYAVLLHATSADAKLWPEAYWIELHNYLFLNNIFCILPWGSDAEHARSTRLAAAMRNAQVPSRLPLEDMAVLLANAQLVIGVDTGLTHLAAALNAPTLGLYCATDPAATGIHGCARALNLGNTGAPPAVREVIAAAQRLGAL